MMQVPERPDLPRISWRTIGDYFLQVFNLERGLGYTTRKMIIDPYGATHEYLFTDRRRMIKPFSFLLLMTGVTTFLLIRTLRNNADLKPQDQLSFLPPEVAELIGNQLLEVFNQYPNLFYMASIPFVSLASYWVFRRSRLFYTEHLVLNTYIFCIQSYLLLLMPVSLKFPVVSLFIVLGYFGYYLYAYTRIFRLPAWEGIWRSAVVIMLSQVLSAVASGLMIALLVLLK